MAKEKDVLAEATAAWRTTRHPRWAAIAAAAAKAELAKGPDRPVVGAGKKKGDTDAWHALAEENDPLDLARLFAALRTTSAEEASHRVKLRGSGMTRASSTSCSPFSRHRRGVRTSSRSS